MQDRLNLRAPASGCRNGFIYYSADSSNDKVSILIISISCVDLKGTSGRKKSLAQMKEREKCKKRAITDLNAPNGSRDIPFQSQKFEQYGRRHFVDF